MTRLLQPSLTAGEMSPSLYARVDLARYQVGLKRCRNFIVRPYGGIENRAGFRFVDESPLINASNSVGWRLIPFVFSTEIAYVVELGPGYAAFYANRAPLRAVVSELPEWSETARYLKYDMVGHNGKAWRSLGTNVNQEPSSVSSRWTQDDRVVIGMPYLVDDVWGVRYTQSADVLYLVHGNHPPMELRRVSASQFVLVEYDNTEGPFRDLNTDESVTVASSSATGNTTITSNAPIFTDGCVGSLIYIETKNLGLVKPWLVGDRSVTVGTLRRSDGKTYKATTVPLVGSSTWTETGNREPIHEEGRSWDGPGDSRTNGSQTWTVGVEWEYQDSGYGIALITGRNSDFSVDAVVQKRFPAAVVGVAPTPSATWSFSGDGGKVYPLAGAVDARFTVTIDGVPVGSDPYHTPPPPSGGGGTGNGGGSGGAGSGVYGSKANIP